MSTSRRLRLDLARYYRLPSVQVSLGVVLALIIIAFFVVFAIRPTLATIAKLEREIESSRKTLSTLETKVGALNKASVLLEKIKPQLPTLEESIPNQGMHYEEIAYNLGALAQNTTVTLESFTIGGSIINSKLIPIYTPNKKHEPIESSITIRIRGNYPQLSVFLTRLTGAIRLTNVESVTIVREGTQKSGKVSGEEQLSMTIMGSIYYMADAQAIEKIIPSKGGK